MNKQNIAFSEIFEICADSALERVLPDSIPLLRFGVNTFTKDGTQHSFEFSPSDADQVIKEFAERKKDLVIDYEHQTLSGAQAPAAGWISDLFKSADGLVAKVRYWTDQAKNFLKNGEYRYFSPVLNFTKSGVAAIHSVAITNHPALHDIPALVANDLNSTFQKNKDVEMKELIKMLGLDLALCDAAADVQHTAVASKVKTLLAVQKELSDFLKLHDVETLDKLTGKIQGMCPLTDKQALEKALRQRDAANAVDKAFADRKLVETSRAWALKFAENDLTGFNDWANGAPVIVPDNKGIEQKPVQAQTPAANANELEIYKMLGLTDKQIEDAQKGVK